MLNVEPRASLVPRWVAGGATALVGGWLLLMLAYAVRKAGIFDGILIDGTFQLLNPMRRIAAGQSLGTDFQLFHGAGTPYLHYPVYAALGSTLFAAEFARYFVSALCHVAAIGIFCFAWARSRSVGIVLTAIALVCSAAQMSLYVPGGSSFGVRTLPPLMVGAMLLLDGSAARRISLTAAALACAFLLGTDQAFAASAGLILGPAIAAAGMGFRSLRRVVVESAIAFLGGLALYAFIVLLITGLDGFVPSLRYWYFDVPGNQFWLFGGGSHESGFALFLQLRMLWLQLLIGCAVAVWAWRSVRPDSIADRAFRERAAVLMLLVYSAASYAPLLGLFDLKYLDAGARALVVLVVCLGWRSWVHRRARVGNGAPLMSPRTVRLAVVSVAIAGIAVLAVVASRTSGRNMSLAALSPATLAGLAARPRLVEHYERDILQARSHLQTLARRDGSAPRVWSQYAGFLEYFTDGFAPSFDYMIHALGSSNWNQYLQTFDRWNPDVVHLYRANVFFTPVHDWLMMDMWPFYEQVLTRYEPHLVTGTSILWGRRTRTLQTSPSTPATVSADSLSVTIPVSAVRALVDLPGTARGLIVADVRYSVSNPWKRLPVFGGLPRYLVRVDGAAGPDYVGSLPPWGEVASIPILIDPSRQPVLRFTVESFLPGARVVVTGARIRSFALVGTDTLLFSN